MTILHLVRSFGGKRLGGSERNVYNLIKLISLKTQEKNTILSDSGIWTHCTKNNTFLEDKRNLFDLFIYLLSNIKANHISNIHVHSNSYYIFLGYFISVFLKCRLIIKITRVGEGSLINREKEKLFNLKLFIKKKLFNYICKSKNVYIHILSKSCKKDVEKFSNNIVVFPNLVKRVLFNSEYKEKDTFIISSRLIKRKNIDFTLDKLLNLKNNNIHIFVMGDGPELYRLKNKYKINKSKIEFLGYLRDDDIYKYYQKAEYFINLSESEGMSNALIEAMTCGCKCIISKIPENIYTSENYAIYYDKGDDLNLKIVASLKLNPRDISNYANSKFSIYFFNSKKLKELYKIDSSCSSSW